MSQYHDTHLVRMVNQIAANLSGGHDEQEAVAGICRHLETFWARPMKRRLVACLEREDNTLAPLARQATRRLAEQLAAKEARDADRA